MNPTDNFNQTLHDWLVDSAPQTMPATTHSGTMDRARRTGQRSRWSATLQGWVADQGIRAVRVGRGVRIAALMAATALIAIMLAGGFGPRPPTPIASPTPFASPSPAGSPLLSTGFQRPFSYAPPLDQSIQSVAPTQGDVFEFIDGSFSGSHGIVVAAIREAVVHDCPNDQGRVVIRSAPPAALLEDLETIGGMTLPAPSETTIDGRAAVRTQRAEGAHTCDTADIHINNGGLGSIFINLLRPGTMVLLEVDGRTILIDIWAVSDAELEIWLPTAMEFVNSFHFINEP